MGQGNLNLAALIGSRICHDLISPIGAITNGLELLDMAGGAAGPEMGLISDSAENAGARIRFFRIAYGAAGDQAMSRSEVVSVLDDLARGARIKSHYGPLDPQARHDVRLAFLGLQCCETAMPYGGTIRISVDNGTWTVEGVADKLNVDADLWGDLNRSEKRVEITPALVQFALLPAVAKDYGRALKITMTETRVRVQF
jgi:histidine phosphotransferase ChpT